jgi:hypothetical protein
VVGGRLDGREFLRVHNEVRKLMDTNLMPRFRHSKFHNELVTHVVANTPVHEIVAPPEVRPPRAMVNATHVTSANSNGGRDSKEVSTHLPHGGPMLAFGTSGNGTTSGSATVAAAAAVAPRSQPVGSRIAAAVASLATGSAPVAPLPPPSASAVEMSAPHASNRVSPCGPPHGDDYDDDYSNSASYSDDDDTTTGHVTQANLTMLDTGLASPVPAYAQSYFNAMTAAANGTKGSNGSPTASRERQQLQQHQPSIGVGGNNSSSTVDHHSPISGTGPRVTGTPHIPYGQPATTNNSTHSVNGTATITVTNHQNGVAPTTNVYQLPSEQFPSASPSSILTTLSSPTHQPQQNHGGSTIYYPGTPAAAALSALDMASSSTSSSAPVNPTPNTLGTPIYGIGTGGINNILNMMANGDGTHGGRASLRIKPNK